MIKTFRAFIKKNIKYFFYAAFILALKEWADFLRGDDLDLLRLIGNTALAFYFWGLSVGKFEFREWYFKIMKDKTLKQIIFGLIGGLIALVVIYLIESSKN